MLEYQECRKVAAQLGQIVTYDLYASAPAEIEYDMTYTRVHESADIARHTFQRRAGERSGCRLLPMRFPVSYRVKSFRSIPALFT